MIFIFVCVVFPLITHSTMGISMNYLYTYDQFSVLCSMFSRLVGVAESPDFWISIAWKYLLLTKQKLSPILIGLRRDQKAKLAWPDFRSKSGPTYASYNFLKICQLFTCLTDTG